MGDDQSARAGADQIAELCWRLLRPLNPVFTITGESRFWEQVCAFSVAPAGFAENLRYCLGLTEQVRPIHTVVWRAWHLAGGTLAVVSEHLDALRLPYDLWEAIRDSTFARCLNQTEGWLPD